MMYRLTGLLVILVAFVVVGSLLPREFVREHGGWLIGLWLVVDLWWFAKSGPREWHEREQREAESRARRSSRQ